MNIQFSDYQGFKIGELISKNIEIHTAQDALELVANCIYQEASHVIVQEKHITTDFFDLKSGIAGEMLQKFSNYRAKLAIVGDFIKYESKALRDFMYESNKVGRINFVNSVEEAKAKLIAND